MNISTREVCPTCNGTGKISASLIVADQVEKNIDHILSKQNERKLTITLHPYLFAYFTRGMYSRRVKWVFKYFKWVNLIEDSSLGLTDFHFINAAGEEIELI